MSLPMTKAYYSAQAFSVTFGTVESTGNHQIAVGFEIVNDAELAGETITWIGFFTDKTAERTIESLLLFQLGLCGPDGRVMSRASLGESPADRGSFSVDGVRRDGC